MTSKPLLIGGDSAESLSPIVEKVFLALRPNFFPGFHKEHVTLRYYNRIRWDVLQQDARRMEKHLPQLLVPYRYDTWQAWGKGPLHDGLILERNAGVLEHLPMPHITMDKRTWNLKPLLINLAPQAVSTLWVGKSINGSYVWAKP